MKRLAVEMSEGLSQGLSKTEMLVVLVAFQNIPFPALFWVFYNLVPVSALGELFEVDGPLFMGLGRRSPFGLLSSTALLPALIIMGLIGGISFPLLIYSVSQRINAVGLEN